MEDKTLPEAPQTLNEQASVKQSEDSAVAQEIGSQLLNDLEERRLARERVLERRRKHIREQYW